LLNAEAADASVNGFQANIAVQTSGLIDFILHSCYLFLLIFSAARTFVFNGKKRALVNDIIGFSWLSMAKFCQPFALPALWIWRHFEGRRGACCRSELRGKI
jgi:hypothetical protein